jgi:hypothetical protein
MMLIKPIAFCVLAQTDSTVKSPKLKTLQDRNRAKIVKLIKMPDGGTTILSRAEAL